MMRHNRPLILLCASSLLFLTGMFSLQTVGVYYARDVLGNADLYIVLTIVQTVGMIVAAVIVPNAVEAIGKRRAYLVVGCDRRRRRASASPSRPDRRRRSASPPSASSDSGWARSTR